MLLYYIITLYYIFNALAAGFEVLGGGSGTTKSWELDQLKKALLLFTPGSYEAAIPAAHPPPSLEVMQTDAGFRVTVRVLGVWAMHTRGCMAEV